MIHRILLLSFVTSISVCCAEDVVVQDDFSAYQQGGSGSPKWQPYLGEWVFRDGQCEQISASRDSAHLFRPDCVVADLDFSVRFKARPEGAGVRTPGMIFRAQDNLNCYYAHFYTRGSQLLLIRQTEQTPWHELARIPGVSIAENEWHTGRVVCRGPKIQVFLDGKLIVERTDDTFAAGVIGLRAGQAHVVFDDVQVRGTRPAEPISWKMKVDPNDESQARKLAGVEDFPVVVGAGYFPVLVLLSDGSLGAAVRGGDAHVGVKGRLDWIRSVDGGRTWTDPTVIVDSQWDDRNAGVGVMADGTVVMAYAEASTYGPDGSWDRSAGKYTMYYVYSTDNGATWTEKIRLCPDLFDFGSPYGRMITLQDGTALMQIYLWPQQGTKELAGTLTREVQPCVGVLRSTDNGRTWGDWTLVANEYNEISLVELANGRIVAGMRREAGDTAVCESDDNGRTWTEPRIITKLRQHPPDLCRLRSGALLMVYGNRLDPKGVQCILSDDGGRTWSYDRRVFLAWKALNRDCGYPSVVQLADGTLVMLYYAVGTEDRPEWQCRCVRFTEAQLRTAMAAQLP